MVKLTRNYVCNVGRLNTAVFALKNVVHFVFSLLSKLYTKAYIEGVWNIMSHLSLQTLKREKYGNAVMKIY